MHGTSINLQKIGQANVPKCMVFQNRVTNVPIQSSNSTLLSDREATLARKVIICYTTHNGELTLTRERTSCHLSI